ncbi:MAG: TMEM175 family protein [Synechococcus sp.]|nr:TMEM175 family protein [Synechococcus sp.]
MTSRNRYFAMATPQVLPFLDGIFAVAFTLMAYSIPEDLRAGGDGLKDLLIAISGFLLGAVAVILFWFKLRRLVLLARELHLTQLILGFLAVLSIVAIPKMGALVVRYGQGAGSISDWTISQGINTLYLGTLFFFDILILLFAASLREHGPLRAGSQRLIADLVHCQLLGTLVLLGLAVLELLTEWFNTEYLLLVPLVLILEELIIALRFAASCEGR